MSGAAVLLTLSSAALAYMPNAHTPRATMMQKFGPRMQASPPTPAKTVGESIYTFQREFPKPILPMFNPFVKEILTTNTLSLGSPRFKYSKIYALGFTSICDNFLGGYPRDADKPKIFTALCTALELDEAQIKQDSQEMQDWAKGKSEEEVLAACSSGEGCGQELKMVADSDAYYYSQPFGAGIFSLMETVECEITDDSLDKWCDALEIRSKRLQDDFKLFQRAKKTLIEMKTMMLDARLRDKQKEAQKLSEKAEKAAKEAAEAEKEAADA